MTREELDQYWKMYGYAMALASLGLPHDFQGDRREWCDVCGAVFNEQIHHQPLPREGEVYSYGGARAMTFAAVQHLLAFVLEAAGERIPGRTERRWRYRDDVIEILARGQAGGIEVIRVANNNPVLIFNEKNELIRQHGEWALIRKHFGSVACSLMNTL